MNLVTVYKAFRKQAAGEMPASPVGGVFKPQPLPPPISAPGAQAAGQPGDPAVSDPTATPDKSMQMLEKGWEKTMDTMKQMTAMNNGVPVAESGAPSSSPAGPDMPGQPPMPPDGITPPQLPKMATVYKSMKKRATWLGRQVNNVFGDTWMGRTFGESPETAAENFYNQQIGSEAVANRKQLAAQYDAAQAKERSRVNTGVDQAVAAEQKRTQNAEAQRLAKQKAADKYIQQLAAQQGVQLSGAQRSRISQNAGIGGSAAQNATTAVAASKPNTQQNRQQRQPQPRV